MTDYRNLPILGDQATPQKVTLRESKDEAPTELTYFLGTWAITLPVSLPADNADVEKMLAALAAITGDLIGTEPPSGAALCSIVLMPPEALKAAQSASSATTPAVTPAMLGFYPDAEDYDNLLAYRADLRRLYRLPRSRVPALLLEGGYTHTLADRTVLTEPAENIRRIAVLRRDGTHTVVARNATSKEWETEAPVGAYINRPALDKWLTCFADLPANRVLQGAPTNYANLRTLGLDHPAFRITLDLTGGEGLRRVLLVGTPNVETGTAPAIIQGRPMLYELDAKTVGLLFLSLTRPEKAE